MGSLGLDKELIREIVKTEIREAILPLKEDLHELKQALREENQEWKEILYLTNSLVEYELSKDEEEGE